MNRMTMCEPSGVFDFQAGLVRLVRQEEPTPIDDFDTPIVESESAARRFDLRAFGQSIVHPKLARIGTAGDAGDPSLTRRIREPPIRGRERTPAAGGRDCNDGQAERFRGEGEFPDIVPQGAQSHAAHTAQQADLVIDEHDGGVVSCSG
jgi:hypothetical protein